MKVLINFHHGLGDTVQFTVVLRHLQKYHPDWTIDTWAAFGKHSAFKGLCRKAWNDQELMQPVDSGYDSVLVPHFLEELAYRQNRPSTKAAKCLEEYFGIPWDKTLGRYSIDSKGEAEVAAWADLESIGCKRMKGRFNAVVIHYQGTSSPGKKNLPHYHAARLVEIVKSMGRVPIILDWQSLSPIPDGKTVFSPPSASKHGDAADLAALINLSEAFIGIDSGPGKIASSTSTPSLICWHGHHPAFFHDPAPNTVHLIPKSKWIPEFFAQNYRFEEFVGGEKGLIQASCKWLERILG